MKQLNCLLDIAQVESHTYITLNIVMKSVIMTHV